MRHVEDIVGKRFGRLTVISFSRVQDKRSYWNCLCDCGKIREVRRTNLVSGNTTSCGCFKSEEVIKRKRKDLTGQLFGKLTVIEYSDTTSGGKARWKCQCSCPEQKIVFVTTDHLVSGHTKSCGCHKLERIQEANTKHGCSSFPEYQVYSGILQRFENENNNRFDRYGERGISISSEWKEDPMLFITWIREQGWFPGCGLEVERINNDLSYNESNCRLATRGEQMRNTSRNHLYEVEGRIYPLIDIIEKYAVVCAQTVRVRLHLGWEIMEALLAPSHMRRKKAMKYIEKFTDLPSIVEFKGENRGRYEEEYSRCPHQEQEQM